MRDAIVRCARLGRTTLKVAAVSADNDFSPKKVGVMLYHGTAMADVVLLGARRFSMPDAAGAPAAPAGAAGAAPTFRDRAMYALRSFVVYAAVMQLFGGFDATCFAAYDEVWPLAPDSARRVAVYRLYHELNHLNLFGRGYYAQCTATLRGLL